MTLPGEFDLPGIPTPLLACIMVTVPENALIRSEIMQRDSDPRMPAILDDDAWPTWLGETAAPFADAKALLKTVEGVSWKTGPEPKAPRPPRKPR